MFAGKGPAMLAGWMTAAVVFLLFVFYCAVGEAKKLKISGELLQNAPVRLHGIAACMGSSLRISDDRYDWCTFFDQGDRAVL